MRTKAEILAVLEARLAAADRLTVERRDIAMPIYQGEFYARKADTYRSVIELVKEITE